MKHLIKSLVVANVLIVIGTAPTHAQNLITNGNFAANAAAFTTSPGYLSGSNPSSITGWTTSGSVGLNGSGIGAGTAFAPTTVPSGVFAFCQGAGSFQQSLTGLAASTKYRLDYQVAARAGNTAQYRVVCSDGSTTYYDSGVVAGNSNAFQQITAYFTTPATLGASPNIQLWAYSGTGDWTIDFANVSLNPSARHAKVFLFAGQSNMTGMGAYSDLTSADLASVSNSYVFVANPSQTPQLMPQGYFQHWLPTNGFYSNYITCFNWVDSNMSWSPMNPGQYDGTQSGFGPEFTCARDLATGLGEPIYFMKYSFAGTGLDPVFTNSNWYDSWYTNAADPNNALYPQYMLSLYHSMTNWAIQARTVARQTEPEAEIAGFFWMQGETDAIDTSTVAKNYTNNLTFFNKKLRSDVGVSNLPLVIGRITTISWTYASYVRGAEVYVGTNDGHAAWVDTDNLPMNATYNNHYSSAGLKTIGSRFASAWLNLKQPPALVNGSGASSIVGTSATLTGSLTSTGGAPTTVTMYWGTTDAGTNGAGWGANHSLGTLPVGAFTYTATSLASCANYYYRALGSNTYGQTWAPLSGSFTMLAIPTITCPANVTVNANAGACYATGVALGTPTASDSCGSVTVTSNAPAQFNKGVTTVTWSATDPTSGNTATCTQTVTVNDTQPPTISCPANVTVNANAGVCYATGVVLGTPTASDNCGSVTVKSNAPAQFNTGVTTVTWTATDPSGNTATCTQTVTVNDTQPPTISCPANVTVNANAGCTATGVALGSPTTSDNCSVASVVSNAPAVYPLGTNVVTWTVTDGSGNTATCTQRVIVRESTPPTISCSANVTVNANAGVCYATGVALGTPTASDSCGSVMVTSNAPAQFNKGVTTVTWTVTGPSGNTATCTQTVTVNDTQPPTISCPANVTVNANAGVCYATGVALGTPTVSDNCGSVTVTSNAPAQFNTGVTTVTWSATDSSGNTATCTQTVTVNDTQPPTISCPADVTVAANAGCTATGVALASPITSDNCSVASVVSNAPAVYPLGTNVVTWTVTDGSGNTATCTQRVIVRETTPPTISCPANVTVNANAGVCYATGVVLGTPTASDNCGSVTVTSNAPAQFNKGVTTVTWTATGPSGNTATCMQTVTVNDTQPPTISCPATVLVNANAGVCYATGVALGTPTVSDNCGSVTVTSNAPAQFNKGITYVTWTATDSSGNTATCSQLVAVRDLQPPTITCPADVTVAANAGCTATGVVLGSPTTSDNCSVASVVSNAPAVYPPGTNLVTWTVTDGSGNTATGTQRVIVQDTQPPTVTCPADVTVSANAGCTATDVVLGSPTTSDNCSVASVVSNAPAVYPLGTNLVTWTVTDGSGNTATGTQRVIVRDTQPRRRSVVRRT